MKKTSKIVIGLILTAGVVLLALPASSVFAQSDEPPQVEAEEQSGQGLEDLYAREIERFEKVGEGIEKSTKVVEKLEDRIAARVEAGRDASDLEEILATFQANMVAVEEAYADVGELIDDHAGFDVDGTDSG